jgi:hypothetical protein
MVKELVDPLVNAADNLVSAATGLTAQALFAGQAVNLTEKYYDKYVLPVVKANAELAKSFSAVQRGVDAQGRSIIVGTSVAADLARQQDMLDQVLLENTSTLHDQDSALRFLSKGQKGLDEQRKISNELVVGLTDALGPLAAAQTKSGESAGFNALKLSILQRAFGLTAAEIGTVAKRAVAFGTSTEAVLLSSAKASTKFAKAFGIDRKVLTRDVGKLQQDFVNFGSFSSEQLASVAARARTLGVSLEGIKKLNMFDNFDQTAEKAAMLSQAFGINVDAFELFAEQDPTKRLEMIREAALAAGQDITQMGRIEQQLLSDLTNLDVGDALVALSPENLGAEALAAGEAATGEAAGLGDERARLGAVFAEVNEKSLREFGQEFGKILDRAPQQFGEMTRDAMRDAILGDVETRQRMTTAGNGLVEAFGGLADQFASPNFPFKKEVLHETAGALGNFTTELKKLSARGGPLDEAIKAQAAGDMEEVTETLREGARIFLKANKELAGDLIEIMDGVAGQIINIMAPLAKTGISAGLNLLGDAAKDATKALKELPKVFAQGKLGEAATKFFEDFAKKQEDRLPETVEALRKQKIINDGIIYANDLASTQSAAMTGILPGGRVVQFNDQDVVAGMPGGFLDNLTQPLTSLPQIAETVDATARVMMSVRDGSLAARTVDVENSSRPLNIVLNMTNDIVFDGQTASNLNAYILNASPLPGGIDTTNQMLENSGVDLA